MMHNIFSDIDSLLHFLNAVDCPGQIMKLLAQILEKSSVKEVCEIIIISIRNSSFYIFLPSIINPVLSFLYALYLIYHFLLSIRGKCSQRWVFPEVSTLTSERSQRLVFSEVSVSRGEYSHK